MLRFKAEVRIAYLDSRLADVLAAACLWSLRTRVDVEINSVNDGRGVHIVGSLHGFDLAVDLDTDGDRSTDLQSLGEYLRRHLPPLYDVVFESDHLHVEYDVHRPPLRQRGP